tara:strand:+ start:1713 stop:1967 length:255 start_codon:yes stop_codon:yes gene_type:complete
MEKEETPQSVYDEIMLVYGETYFEWLYEFCHTGLMTMSVNMAKAMLIHFEDVEDYDKCDIINEEVKKAEEEGSVIVHFEKRLFS